MIDSINRIISPLNGGVKTPVAFGPCMSRGGYPWRKPKTRNKITQFLFRVWSRIYLNPKADREYVKSVESAIRSGFYIIDYSASYGDGKLLAKGIKKSGIKRENLYITLRISDTAQRTHTIREEILRMMDNMGLSYVDLVQFHWPVESVFIDTWKEMEVLYEEGVTRQIGVANCNIHHLQDILSSCTHRPFVGQFEIHPLFTQKKLIKFYQDNGIVVEAYTPIAQYDDRLFRLKSLQRLEKKYNKTAVQIVLRWHIQNGCVPVVRVMNHQHQISNLDIMDFEIDDDDMRLIDSYNINSRLRFDPDNCEFTKF